jgi:uncharacterized protein YbjT (DUF2867 family)
MRLLIAGATGYLGRHLCAAAGQRGHWVRALARDPARLDRATPFLEPPVREQVDEVFEAEATDAGSLAGCCDGVDAVISSLGITRQTDKVTFHDVDYQANRNVLDHALEAGVRRFVFVSVFQAEMLAGISMTEAREAFVRDLRREEVDATVVRPTGFYSDMSEFFHMARAGRVWVVGNGAARINPIHGADLAAVCLDALDLDEDEIGAGGPDIYSYREIAEVAFSVLGKPPRISGVPPLLVSATLALTRPFSARYHDLGRFFATVTQNDFIAPARGTHRLVDYFRELAAAEERAKG